MRWSGKSRWLLRWVVAGLPFVLVVGTVLAFVAGMPNEGLDRADKLASVGSLLIGVAALLFAGMALRVAVREVEQQSASAGADEAVRLDRAAGRLADAVRRQWTHEAESRQLRRPLRVRWSTTERPVSAQPAVVLGEDVMPGRPIRLRLHGDLSDVVEAFRQLPARQLVVLGEPGAGKTVLAMLLTLGLLDTRAPDEPVPVLLPISSWNPSAEHLRTWLARRLVEDYPALANTEVYGPDAAGRLAHGGRLIPVLDGLDELPPTLRNAAIEALDRAVADSGPLVMTCRSDEYQAAVIASGRFLSRAAVVEIEPVDVAGSIEFLAAAQAVGDTRWQPVLDHLRTHPAGSLAQALSTPLMAYLARIAYADPTTSPAELCDPRRFLDRVALEEHLLDAYLPSVYSNHPPPRPTPDQAPAVIRRSYSSDQARRWLTFVARHLHQQQTRDLAWWQLHHALPHRAKKWVGGFVLGLMTGLVCAIGIGIGLGPVGIAAGFMGGLAADFVVALMAGPPSHPRQVNTQLRDRRRQGGQELAVGIMAGLGVGIVVGISVGITVGIVVGVTFGLGVGITVAITIGLLGGLTQWLHVPADAIRSPSPRTVLRGDRTVSGIWTFFSLFGVVLVIGLAVAAVGGMTIGIPTGLAVGLVSGLVGGLVSGLASRFAAGFVGGLSFVASAWGWSLISRCWLALADRSPWRLMTFLDDAHRRGVLRQTGAVYQFRHAQLQDRLADVDAA